MPNPRSFLDNTDAENISKLSEENFAKILDSLRIIATSFEEIIQKTNIEKRIEEFLKLAYEEILKISGGFPRDVKFKDKIKQSILFKSNKQDLKPEEKAVDTIVNELVEALKHTSSRRPQVTKQVLARHINFFDQYGIIDAFKEQQEVKESEVNTQQRNFKKSSTYSYINPLTYGLFACVGSYSILAYAMPALGEALFESSISYTAIANITINPVIIAVSLAIGSCAYLATKCSLPSTRGCS